MMTPDELPTRVADRKSVPESYRIAYEKRAHGYLLDKRIAHVVYEGEREVAELKAKIAGVRAEMDAIQAGTRKRTIMRNLELEAEAAGIRPKLCRAVAATLSEGVEFEIEGSMDGVGEVVIARTEQGLKSAGALVRDFLLSDDGAGFRPPRSAPDEGRFTAMVESMKRAR
jgi:hypothetical protein